MAFVLTNSHVSAAHAADVVSLNAPATQERDVRVLPSFDGTLPASKGKNPPALRTLHTTATAYNSQPNQTDSSPFITASGSCVREGVVASNAFRIGTKIRMPELFGDKIFVVEDRMNERYSKRVDIWMASEDDAREFGLKRGVKIEVISDGDGKKHWEEGWTNVECASLNT